MRLTSVRVFVAAIALLAAVVGPLTALGPAQAAAPPATWTVQVGSQASHEALQGMRFLPGDVTVDAGDTVRWVARSTEIHTVTFFPGGGPQTTLPDFNPADLTQLTRQGGSVYDPSAGFNSGLMTSVPDKGDVGPLPPVPHVGSYSLTFPAAGTFTYYCLVHGKMMVGVVHVQAAGTAYPYTQAEYNDQARIARAGLAAMGNHIRRDLVRRSSAAPGVHGRRQRRRGGHALPARPRRGAPRRAGRVPQPGHGCAAHRHLRARAATARAVRTVRDPGALLRRQAELRDHRAARLLHGPVHQGRHLPLRVRPARQHGHGR